MHNAIATCITVTSLSFAALSGIGTVSKYAQGDAIYGYATRSTPVHPGEVVTIEWHLTKLVDCPGEFSRVWIGPNGFRVVESQRHSSIPMSPSEQIYRIPTEIPTLAPIGNLELYIEGEYDCASGVRYYSIGPVNLIVEE